MHRPDGLVVLLADLRERAPAVLEIAPHAEFYDYGAKYAQGGSDHIIPARVDPDVAARAQALALRAAFMRPAPLSSAALLAKNPDPSVDDIKQALARNLCRCGTHTRMIKAVQRAAKDMKAAK